MKRFACILLVLLFLFSVTACKKNNSDSNSSLPDNTTSGFISLDIEDDSNDENNDAEKDTSSEDSSVSDNESDKNNSKKPNSSKNSDFSNGNTDTNVNSKDESNTASNNNSTTSNNSNKPSNTGSKNNSTNGSASKDNANNSPNGDSNDGFEGDNTDGSSKGSSGDNPAVGDSNGAGNNQNNDSKNNSSNNSGNNSGTQENDSQNNKKPNGTDNSSGTTTEPDSSNSQGGNSNTGNNSSEYSNIKCRSISEGGWKTTEIAVNSNKLYIRLPLPNDWVITENGIIMRNNSEIGVISTKLSDSHVDIYEQTSRDTDSVIFKKSVRKYTSGTNNEFKRVFSISQITESLANNLFITINYSELDEAAASKILNNMTYLGIYRPIPAIKNNSKKLLLLGNSFISSSQIGDFLSDMLKTDNKGYSVETMSVDGAEVKNFADNTELINRIKSGEFAIVFQSCFYTDEKSWGSADKDGPLKTIIDACKVSDTALIILPAHNESSPVLKRALDKYTDIYCIDWKNEIDLLINSGIGDGSPSNLTKSDFCSNDTYAHSTPLAGYVGAHMIYRTIFSKIPPVLTSSAPLSMNEINNKLLNYASSGIIPGQSQIAKYLIK